MVFQEERSALLQEIHGDLQSGGTRSLDDDPLDAGQRAGPDSDPSAHLQTRLGSQRCARFNQLMDVAKIPRQLDAVGNLQPA